MNPDQTAPNGSILFAIYATKVHRQKNKQTTIVENSRKVNLEILTYGPLICTVIHPMLIVSN